MKNSLYGESSLFSGSLYREPTVLEIPASRVFLGTDAQLLGTSLAGAKMF